MNTKEEIAKEMRKRIETRSYNGMPLAHYVTMLGEVLTEVASEYLSDLSKRTSP